MHIGCHLSSTKGYLAMGKEAMRIDADTFSFFTRNPRGGAAKAPDEEDMASLRELMEKQKKLEGDLEEKMERWEYLTELHEQILAQKR